MLADIISTMQWPSCPQDELWKTKKQMFGGLFSSAKIVVHNIILFTTNLLDSHGIGTSDNHQQVLNGGMSTFQIHYTLR